MIIAQSGMQSFFDRLRVVMTAKGWTRTTLAQKIDMSLSTVSRWANGKNPPTSTSVDRIITAIGLNREWLLTGRGEPWSQSAQVEGLGMTARMDTEEAKMKYFEEVDNKLDIYLNKFNHTISSKDRYIFKTFVETQYAKGRKITPEGLDIFFEYIGNIRDLLP